MQDNFDDISPDRLNYLRELEERHDADPTLLRYFIDVAYRRQEA